MWALALTSSMTHARPFISWTVRCLPDPDVGLAHRACGFVTVAQDHLSDHPCRGVWHGEAVGVSAHLFGQLSRPVIQWPNLEVTVGLGFSPLKSVRSDTAPGDPSSSATALVSHPHWPSPQVAGDKVELRAQIINTMGNGKQRQTVSDPEPSFSPPQKSNMAAKVPLSSLLPPLSPSLSPLSSSLRATGTAPPPTPSPSNITCTYTDNSCLFDVVQTQVRKSRRRVFPPLLTERATLSNLMV